MVIKKDILEVFVTLLGFMHIYSDYHKITPINIGF